MFVGRTIFIYTVYAYLQVEPSFCVHWFISTYLDIVQLSFRIIYISFHHPFTAFLVHNYFTPVKLLALMAVWCVIDVNH